MSIIYQCGSLCEDCLQFGLQNSLKYFFINLEEQIIKCESSSCMFPYLRKPVISDLTNSKPSDNANFLDELIEQRLNQIEETPAKSEEAEKPQIEEQKDAVDEFDFSSIFMDNEIKPEVKENPLVAVKQELNVKPVVLESKVIKAPSNIEASKDSKRIGMHNTITQKKSVAKPRLSRCLKDVRSKLKSSNAKKKSHTGKVEPVLVVEPQSGKAMRPLDLIRRYVKKN